MWFVVGGGLLILLAILGVLIASAGDREGTGGRFPQIGDHWHANYSITICGVSEPPFPVSQGGVHTHGNGVIHIHPNNPVDTGTNAHLARFLASTGTTLTNDSLELPSGEAYTNGDPCPDGQTGQMFLRVNGINMTAVADYVPRDEDRIELGFEAQ
jgi:hypothetical protein